VHVASLQKTSDEAKGFFRGHDSYWILRNGMWPMTPALYGIPTIFENDIDETQLLHTRKLLEIATALGTHGRGDWVDVLSPMCNVGYVFVYRDAKSELARVGGNWEDAIPVDSLPWAAFPRYYFSKQILETKSSDGLLERLANEKLDPSVAFVSFRPFVPATGRVLAAAETPNESTIDVEATGEALLVMSVTRHKYWKATIDGAPTRLEPANIAFQALRIPAGRHRVRMKYSNPLVSVGGLISVASILALATVARRAGPRRLQVGGQG
jgi:hypothetical protein